MCGMAREHLQESFFIINDALIESWARYSSGDAGNTVAVVVDVVQVTNMHTIVLAQTTDTNGLNPAKTSWQKDKIHFIKDWLISTIPEVEKLCEFLERFNIS